MTAEGPVPTPPAQLRASIEASVATTNPGFSGNFPGTLIEDVLSTDVAAAQVCDSARVEAINSLTPYGANAYLANQLGSIYGIPIGIGSNTSVEVQFYNSTPGFPIIPGFTVGDGTYTYVIQDGGTIAADGTSGLLSAVATQQGSWPVVQNTVQQIETSVPSGITLYVTNPQAGLPGSSGQLVSDYQAQVLQAGLAASTGMTRYLKTLLANVPGVQRRLLSARPVTAPQGWPGWEIIVGGGDNYQVAGAIYNSLFDVSTLVGSTLAVTAITQAANAQVTTDLNHGYAVGQVIQITGVVMTGWPNGTNISVATVVDEKNFTVNVNSSAFGSYVSGGVCTPNFRNVVATIVDYPDSYDIPFVSPPQQTVTVALTWNTTLINFTGAVTVQQLGQPAIVDYINSIPVGAPINVFEMQAVFQAAIASVLSPINLTRMVFSVGINGISTAPTAGTGIISGDPESYFQTAAASVTITQG
jgi:hypothetical protein